MRDGAKKNGLTVDKKPALGSVFWRPRGTSGTQGHVGVVVKIADGMVYTIEGNSSNAVRGRNYKQSEMVQDHVFIHTELMFGTAGCSPVETVQTLFADQKNAIVITAMALVVGIVIKKIVFK